MLPIEIMSGFFLASLSSAARIASLAVAEPPGELIRATTARSKPQWSHRDPERKPFPFEAPFHPAEVAHEVFQAYTTFALWDVARRAHLGIAPDEYRQQIGELFAPMTEITSSSIRISAW